VFWLKGGIAKCWMKRKVTNCYETKRFEDSTSQALAGRSTYTVAGEVSEYPLRGGSRCLAKIFREHCKKSIDMRSNKGTRRMLVEVSRQSALQSRTFFERCDTDIIKQDQSLLYIELARTKAFEKFFKAQVV
jgi:ectoine hydroxylase-related dioxygenase (phytanoyl-CoA dioxygenase family)